MCEYECANYVEHLSRSVKAAKKFAILCALYGICLDKNGRVCVCARVRSPNK